MTELRKDSRAINPRDFEVAGVKYQLAEYRNGMTGSHLKVTKLSGEPFTVMTRGLEYGSRPFWVGGYAIGEREVRDAIASAVAALADGPASSGSV